MAAATNQINKAHLKALSTTRRAGVSTSAHDAMRAPKRGARPLPLDATEWPPHDLLTLQPLLQFGS
jgi:hypothetical protein